MKHKYSFAEPDCSGCPNYKPVGPVFNQTRYCDGFKRKRPKRFRSSDPYTKPPKWCPRRLAPPVCRIYGFANERSRVVDSMTRADFNRTEKYIYPLEFHYMIRKEMPLNMTAKQFYQKAQEEPLEEILSDSDLALGEVIEIDNGLKSYYFYYLTYSKIVPAPLFQPQRIRAHITKGDDNGHQEND